MLFTGHHTTVVAIGYGALLLLTNPVERQAVLNDPATLPDVIEECLRIGNVGVNTGGGNGIDLRQKGHRYRHSRQDRGVGPAGHRSG